MSKSKSLHEQQNTKINNEYLNDYNDLLNVLQNMMQHCINTRSEIFAQAQFLRVIASRKCYFDNLRDQVADAAKSGDTNKLSFLVNIVNNSLDNKVCDLIWQQAADMYDSFVNLNAEQEINEDNARISFKTSDEILSECRKYYTESKEQKNAELVKTLQFMLNESL